MHAIDEAVQIVARDQWGTFGDRQAKSFGASRQFIARRLERRDWVRLAEGALGFPDWPPSYERSVWTSLHAGHAAALVGPLAAAALYGFKTFARNRFDLLTPHGTTHSNPIAVVTQTRHMPQMVRFNGFPMPPRERVICEIARKVGARRLGIAIDDQLVKKTMSLPRVERTFLGLAVPGWPGLTVMQEVLAERRDDYVPPRSDLERDLRLIVAMIPDIKPFFEKQIGDKIELAHQVDCVIEWPRKLILEADGRAWHQRVREMGLDRRRDRRASALGYTTYRYLYAEIVHDREAVRQEILAYLFK